MLEKLQLRGEEQWQILALEWIFSYMSFTKLQATGN